MELRSELQQIYECIAIQKMSIRETAGLLGIPKSTVHLLIHRDLKDESLFKYTCVKAVLDCNRVRKRGRRVGSSK